MAENQDGQEKTEEPSQKRLSDAFNRGQTPKSVDVTTAAILLPGGAAVFILGKNAMNQTMGLMNELLSHPLSYRLTDQNFIAFFGNMTSFLAATVLPIILSLFVLALAAEVAQTGLKFASEKFTKGLNWQNIVNPFGGIKKIFFSSRSGVELIKSVIKVIILGLVAYNVLYKKSEEVFTLMQRPFIDMGVFIANSAFELFYKLGIIYVAIAAADFFYQRYKFKEDLKMTLQEVKEETKQTEGDPKIKARMRSLMMGRVRKQMIQKTQTADVVITNPTHYAVAIKYESGKMSAPIVVAKGVDFLAFKIRETAQSANVPIIEDPPLARALYASVEIDREIPEELFKAVAQVLAFVFQMKNNKN